MDHPMLARKPTAMANQYPNCKGPLIEIDHHGERLRATANFTAETSI
jgi:hypothetical protein